MKKIVLILIISLFELTQIFSQTLDKYYIDNWIPTVFPHSIIDDGTVYIVNRNKNKIMPYAGSLCDIRYYTKEIRIE